MNILLGLFRLLYLADSDSGSGPASSFGAMLSPCCPKLKSPPCSKGKFIKRYYFPDSPTSSFFSLRCFNISQGMSTTAITAKEIKA